MKKILLAFLLCTVIALTSMPAYATDIDMKQIEDRNDGEELDLGVYAVGNNQTVNALLENSKFTARQGHGFAAENGNNLIDRLKGKNATVVGGDNLKNGPDRKIINRDGSVTWIQDKYYIDAKSGVEACFENGKFRYIDGNGNPMQIEVPSDQYEEAVACMREKIKQGMIDGITDPYEAENLIRKGNLTYKQAVNIAKAGTVESLKYDAVNGTISAACGFGISAVVNYAVCRMNGDDRQEALRTMAIEGIKSGGVVFATSVIAAQLARTDAVKIFAPSAEALTKALGPDFSKILLNSVGANTAGMSSSSLMSKAAKVLQNQGLTAAITVVVLTADDVAELFQGRISAEQLLKNLTVTSAGVIGGYVGSTVGGAAGTAIAPGVGTTAGSVAGAVIIGGATGIISDKVLSVFVKDDADKMLEIIQSEFQQLGEDYLLDEEEANAVIDALEDELSSDHLKEMYASEDQNGYARKMIEPLINEQISKREVIESPTEEELRAELVASLAGVVFIH